MRDTIQIQKQAKIEGEALKWGKCICGQCGNKGKMGTTTIPTMQNPVAKILCLDCTVKDIATRHNLPLKEAKERHERTHKAQERLVKVILERYHETTGKRPPMKMADLAPILQPGMTWWHQGISESEKDRVSKLSKDEQKQFFRNSPILPPPKTPIVKEQEPGRNDPCKCGSGKKYKKCCLEKAA